MTAIKATTPRLPKAKMPGYLDVQRRRSEKPNVEAPVLRETPQRLVNVARSSQRLKGTSAHQLRPVQKSVYGEERVKGQVDARPFLRGGKTWDLSLPSSRRDFHREVVNKPAWGDLIAYENVQGLLEYGFVKHVYADGEIDPEPVVGNGVSGRVRTVVASIATDVVADQEITRDDRVYNLDLRADLVAYVNAVISDPRPGDEVIVRGEDGRAYVSTVDSVAGGKVKVLQPGGYGRLEIARRDVLAPFIVPLAS